MIELVIASYLVLKQKKVYQNRTNIIEAYTRYILKANTCSMIARLEIIQRTFDVIQHVVKTFQNSNTT